MTEQWDEYVAEALSQIEYVQSLEILEKGPEWVRLWSTLELEWSEGEPRYITLPATSAASDASLASSAKDCADAFSLAKLVISSRMRAGVVLPEKLRDLIACWIEGNFEPPKAKKGPPVSNNWHRDFMIRHILDVLEDRYEIQRTSSSTRAKPKLSGAKIVHEALSRAGLHPPSVETIQNLATGEEVLEIHYEIRGLLPADEFDRLDPTERI